MGIYNVVLGDQGHQVDGEEGEKEVDDEDAVGRDIEGEAEDEEDEGENGPLVELSRPCLEARGTYWMSSVGDKNK